MKVVISSGHGKKIRGASGYIDEVDEARLVVDAVAVELRKLGVDTTTFHDDVSTSQGENLDRIVNFHNGKTRDLDISVHFNAYETTSKAMGAEVLYASNAGLEKAEWVVDGICEASGLINRGPKKRTDLAFLNGTDETAILIETCFVDSQADVDIYRRKAAAIAHAIAASVAGVEEPALPWEPDRPVIIPPAPPTETARRELKKGMTGTDVAELQKVLGLPADGDFGEITHQQVQGFQAASDLDADGIVGPQTWGEVDALAKRLRQDTPPVTGELKAKIIRLAEDSPLMEFYWPDRGVSPAGYLPGMALCYAAAVIEYYDDCAAPLAMAGPLGDDSVDALAWYKREFDALGMSNARPGVAVLRHTFDLMIGLAMRESSGRYFEGRDVSASNTQPETAEAGLLQTSWNIASAHASIPPLLDQFWKNPNGFLDPFRQGIKPSANNLDCFGSGDGATYQWLAKYCPLFAVMVTGVGLRTRRQHWGPINERKALVTRDADDLLKKVEALVEIELA